MKKSLSVLLAIILLSAAMIIPSQAVTADGESVGAYVDDSGSVGAYPAISALKISRVYQPNSGSDCYWSSMMTVQGYCLNSYTYGGVTTNYRKAGTDYNSIDGNNAISKRLKPQMSVYANSYSDYPVKMSYYNGVGNNADTYQKIYNQLKLGRPVVVYALGSSFNHASVVIAYNGSSSTLDPAGFTIMEVKRNTGTSSSGYNYVWWSNSAGEYNSYSNKPQTDTGSGSSLSCYVTLKSWLSYLGSGKIQQLAYPSGYTEQSAYQDLGTGFYANIFSTANTNFAVAANDSNNVILANKSYIDNQKWLFERDKDKSYRITNAKSKLCIDVAGAKTANGTNIQVYPNNDHDNQRWFIVKDGSGYVLVPRLVTTSAMDITGGTLANGTNIELYKRNQSNAQRFTISKIGNYNIAYNANGGTGTMASSTVAVNGKLNIAACGFTRSGYTFGGYNVYRSTDSTWYAAGVNQWLSNSVIMHSGYTKYHYNAGSTYNFGGPWTNGAANGCTYTFYPIWLPNNPKLFFYNNYSGCNYMRGSNLGDDYGSYFIDRSTDDIYTISVDETEKLNNQNSLKIESSAVGTYLQDMVFCTSTNSGRFEGSNGAFDYAGDNKNMTMSFWAKASTNGTKMYFRWGYQSEYRSVTLTTDWQFYTIPMNKNVNCGRNMHPYIDTPGTVWLNDITLVDGASAAQDNFRMETESLPYEQAYVRGGKYTSLPQPERDGYTFLGWFTQANGGTQITTNTNVADYTTTVYAHWQKNNSDTPLAILMKGNKRFEIYDNDMTWEEAKEFCEAKGGHLPTINSSEENDMVASLIAGNCCTAWLGAKLNTDTENWEWITDEEFDYTNWAPGKPGGGANGLYAQMLSFDIGLDQTAGCWNDTANIHNIATLFSIENCMVICEYDLLLGDANNDGVVDIRDVTAIQRNAAETEFITGTSLYDADTDGNGAVDINDATVLQEFLAEFDVVMGRQ